MRWFVLCGIVGLCACDPSDDGELRHGVVKLGMVRGASQDASPFAGASEVVATLIYGECLVDFYANNPDMRQDGVEGAKVFGTLAEGGEGWMDRLCDDSSPHAQCEVVSIEQQLDDGMPRLTVVYATTGELEGHELHFGPLPDEDLADCDGDLLPEVRMQAVRGIDTNSDIVWDTQTFDPSAAVVGQGAAISIYAAVVD